MKESKEEGTLSTLDVSPGVSPIQSLSTSQTSTKCAEEPRFMDKATKYHEEDESEENFMPTGMFILMALA
jgi:hypothetical protein